MALTIFLYLDVYSTFPMSKVWFLSPNTFCFGFADFSVLCCGDVFVSSVDTSSNLRPYTPSVMSQPRQNQGLEMLHILCVGHILGLLVHRHLLLCLLKGPCALLVVAEVAAVPSDDYKELHDVLLVSLDAHTCGGPLELAVKIR